uniref:alpha-glucosidase n=1 Tax=Syphacia muris TaxID=451379 RepID=A0A0N5B193_9BILA
MDSVNLMPGPEKRVPRLYEVEKGQKTESYISAITGNSLLTKKKAPPLCKPDKVIKMFYIDEKFTVIYSFFVHFRWLLLILLVIVLIAMIIASILIILFSPSCNPVYKPFWWNNAIIYQIWTPSFQDSDGNGLGDLAGLRIRLGRLRKQGINAVWVNPFLESDNFTRAIRDYRTIDPKLGTMEDAEKLIAEAHKHMAFIITLPIAITSRSHSWFMRSSSRASNPINANFSGFYHWRRGNGSSLDEAMYTEYNNTTIFYMHYANKPNLPVLNWQNDSVREHMFVSLFSYWIDKGIDAFYLSDIEYLARTSSGMSSNWNNIQDIIRDIRNYVDTYSKESAVTKNKKIVLFADRKDATEDDKRKLVNSGLNSVVNYELGTISDSSEICGGTDQIGSCTHEILSDILIFHNESPEIFGNSELPRLASRVHSRAQAELLSMIQFLLPGANSFYYGEEIGMRNLINSTKCHAQQGVMQWDDAQNAGFSTAQQLKVNLHSDYKNINYERQLREKYSQLKTFRALAKLRSADATLIRGKTFIGKLVNEHAFTVSRFRYNDTANDTDDVNCLKEFSFKFSAITIYKLHLM